MAKPDLTKPEVRARIASLKDQLLKLRERAEEIDLGAFGRKVHSQDIPEDIQPDVAKVYAQYAPGEVEYVRSLLNSETGPHYLPNLRHPFKKTPFVLPPPQKVNKYLLVNERAPVLETKYREPDYGLPDNDDLNTPSMKNPAMANDPNFFYKGDDGKLHRNINMIPSRQQEIFRPEPRTRDNAAQDKTWIDPTGHDMDIEFDPHPYPIEGVDAQNRKIKEQIDYNPRRENFVPTPQARHPFKSAKREKAIKNKELARLSLQQRIDDRFTYAKEKNMPKAAELKWPLVEEFGPAHRGEQTEAQLQYEASIPTAANLQQLLGKITPKGQVRTQADIDAELQNLNMYIHQLSQPQGPAARIKHGFTKPRVMADDLTQNPLSKFPPVKHDENWFAKEEGTLKESQRIRAEEADANLKELSKPVPQIQQEAGTHWTNQAFTVSQPGMAYDMPDITSNPFYQAPNVRTDYQTNVGEQVQRIRDRRQGAKDARDANTRRAKARDPNFNEANPAGDFALDTSGGGYGYAREDLNNPVLVPNRGEPTINTRTRTTVDKTGTLDPLTGKYKKKKSPAQRALQQQQAILAMAQLQAQQQQVIVAPAMVGGGQGGPPPAQPPQGGQGGQPQQPPQQPLNPQQQAQANIAQLNANLANNPQGQWNPGAPAALNMMMQAQLGGQGNVPNNNIAVGAWNQGAVNPFPQPGLPQAAPAAYVPPQAAPQPQANPNPQAAAPAAYNPPQPQMLPGAPPPAFNPPLPQAAPLPPGAQGAGGQPPAQPPAAAAPPPAAAPAGGPAPAGANMPHARWVGPPPPGWGAPLPPPPPPPPGWPQGGAGGAGGQGGAGMYPNKYGGKNKRNKKFRGGKYSPQGADGWDEDELPQPPAQGGGIMGSLGRFGQKSQGFGKNVAGLGASFGKALGGIGQGLSSIANPASQIVGAVGAAKDVVMDVFGVREAREKAKRDEEEARYMARLKHAEEMRQLQKQESEQERLRRINQEKYDAEETNKKVILDQYRAAQASQYGQENAFGNVHWEGSIEGGDRRLVSELDELQQLKKQKAHEMTEEIASKDAYGRVAKDVQNSILEGWERNNAPRYAQEEENMKKKLLARGFVEGSSAWRKMEKNMRDAQAKERADVHDQALQLGHKYGAEAFDQKLKVYDKMNDFVDPLGMYKDTAEIGTKHIEKSVLPSLEYAGQRADADANNQAEADRLALDMEIARHNADAKQRDMYAQEEMLDTKHGYDTEDNTKKYKHEEEMEGGKYYHESGMQDTRLEHETDQMYQERMLKQRIADQEYYLKQRLGDQESADKRYMTDEDINAKKYIAGQESRDKRYITDEDIKGKKYMTDQEMNTKRYITDEDVKSKKYITDEDIRNKKYMTDEDMANRRYVNDQTLAYNKYHGDQERSLRAHEGNADRYSREQIAIKGITSEEQRELTRLQHSEALVDKEKYYDMLEKINDRQQQTRERQGREAHETGERHGREAQETRERQGRETHETKESKAERRKQKKIAAYQRQLQRDLQTEEQGFLGGQNEAQRRAERDIAAEREITSRYNAMQERSLKNAQFREDILHRSHNEAKQRENERTLQTQRLDRQESLEYQKQMAEMDKLEAQNKYLASEHAQTRQHDLLSLDQKSRVEKWLEEHRTAASQEDRNAKFRENERIRLNEVDLAKNEKAIDFARKDKQAKELLDQQENLKLSIQKDMAKEKRELAEYKNNLEGKKLTAAHLMEMDEIRARHDQKRSWLSDAANGVFKAFSAYTAFAEQKDSASWRNFQKNKERLSLYFAPENRREQGFFGSLLNPTDEKKFTLGQITDMLNQRGH